MAVMLEMCGVGFVLLGFCAVGLGVGSGGGSGPLQLLSVAPGIGIDSNDNINNSNSNSSNNNNKNNISNNINNNNTLNPPNPPGILAYACHGPTFGHSLTVDSCSNAIASVGINTTPLSVGPRDSGGPFDVVLPQRFISSDGTCAIELVLEQGAEAALASAEDVSVAAFLVVRNCVAKGLGLGGVARDIGGDNHLRVVVAEYDPSEIRCYGKMPLDGARTSCQQLLNTMLTSKVGQYFGPETDPVVDVQVPSVLISGDWRCKMTIRTTGKDDGFTDLWSWYDAWEVGVTLAGVCVEKGKEGVQTILGENGWLYMEVGGPQSGLEGNETGD